MVSKILIYSPFCMTSRLLLETPIAHYLSKAKEVKIIFTSPFPEDEHVINNLGCGHFEWIKAPIANGNQHLLKKDNFLLFYKNRLWRILLKVLGKTLEYSSLAYRFNHLKGFRSHQFKVRMKKVRRMIESKLAGNYVEPEMGTPFPSSHLLYKLLYLIYHSKWNWHEDIERFIDLQSPDLFVAVHLQHPQLAPIMACVRRKKIKSIGVISSWDQLTTKGPLPPGISLYLVQSEIMKNEIHEYHRVDLNKVCVSGWPTMDIYHRKDFHLTKSDFLSKLGLPANAAIALYTTNGERLGPHEPNIAEKLAKRFDQNLFGEDVFFIVRPHPIDSRWDLRFGKIKQFKNCLLLPAENGNLQFFYNLLIHSNVVIASTTSASIDALAVNTPVVSVVFDGDLKLDHYEKTERWFEMEHYRPIMKTNSTLKARDHSELYKAIEDYLHNPKLHDLDRKLLRDLLLAPFDGNASFRIVQCIVNSIAEKL